MSLKRFKIIRQHWAIVPLQCGVKTLMQLDVFLICFNETATSVFLIDNQYQ